VRHCQHRHAGLVPAIYIFLLSRTKDVDARDKRRCKIISPHPEERRTFAARLEGWLLALPCRLPSFETAAQEGGLLRMKAFSFFTRSSAGMTLA
jgi:hypothetical protein